MSEAKPAKAEPKAAKVETTPLPKEAEAHASDLSALPSYGAVVNVCDPLARLADGSACPLLSWPRTGNAQADRRSFAAAFLGLSGTFHNPAAKEAARHPTPTLRVMVGGAWIWAVQGDVKAKAPLGPAIDKAGKFVSGVLEVVPADEAIAEAVSGDGQGWKAKLYKRPGVA